MKRAPALGAAAEQAGAWLLPAPLRAPLPDPQESLGDHSRGPGEAPPVSTVFMFTNHGPTTVPDPSLSMVPTPHWVWRPQSPPPWTILPPLAAAWTLPSNLPQRCPIRPPPALVTNFLPHLII